MKFKATISHEGVKSFLALTQALNKVPIEEGKCVLLLSPTTLELRLTSESDTFRAYGKLTPDCFKNVHAVSKNINNEISLLITLVSISSAFKSADKADEAILRLAKKNGIPVLTMTAETLNGISVTQDVPIVKILTASEATRYGEPQLRKPQVTLNLPDGKHFKTVLERLKALDKRAKVKASSRGVLYIKVETEIVSTCTVFQGLKFTDMDDVNLTPPDDSNQQSKPKRHHSLNTDVDDVALTASFSIKEMLTVAQGAVAVKPRKSVLAIVDGCVIVVHFELQEKATMTYFISTLVDDDGNNNNISDDEQNNQQSMMEEESERDL
jgi:hypothetical protein